MGDRKNFVNAPQVQSTNDASIVSKCSMAASGYVKDEYVKYFVQKEKSRASLIHLGYYTRSVVISGIVAHFIKFLHHKKMLEFQIISCGAGFDTAYWRLVESSLLNNKSIYIEIDYPDVINKKFTLIRESEKLHEKLNIQENDETAQVKKLSDNYYLISADLSHVKTVGNILKKINVDFCIPTLILSECVITYMKTKDADKLLKWMTQTFQNCCFLNYEQVHPEDGFGCVMLRHFDKLHSPLHSVLTYPDFNSHIRRYRSLGFESTIVGSEWAFLMHLTDFDERKRIMTLEQFDEFEEFHLKCSHYVVGVAANNTIRGFLTDMELSCDSTCEGFGSFVVENKLQGLELFGHSTCEIGGEVLTFGGFGPGGRSKKINVFRKGKNGAVRITGGEKIRLDAIHGTAVSFEIHGKSYIGLYGGRTSPNNVINNGDFIILEYGPENVDVKDILSCQGGPTPRYRCSVVSHTGNGSGVSAWIFGGRTPDLKETLSDLWQLSLKPDCEKFKFNWIKKVRDLAPCGRMSHSAIVCPVKKAMYITGGLDAQNFTILSDIWKWCFATESWEEIKPKTGILTPRYGHSSHIRGTVLYMIGGVSTNAGCQPGVACFDFDTLNVNQYIIEPFRPEPILLFNHTSAILEDENDNAHIAIFGGGGNCFSFGTYFNKGVHSIPLEQFNVRNEELKPKVET